MTTTEHDQQGLSPGQPRNRGHRNTNERGSSATRRRRRQWLLDHFGDGVQAPCHAPTATGICGAMVTMATMIVGRIVPWVHGGTYARDNIRPECAGCSTREGQRRTTAARYGGTT